MRQIESSYFIYVALSATISRQNRNRFPTKESEMLVEIRALGFRLTDAISRYAESRIESVLRRFGHRVLKVTVRLDDVNAGRGGIDKRCSVVVAVRRRGVVVA